MKVIKVRPRGYCKGVIRAISIARQCALDHPDRPITVLGMLVHNAYVKKALEEKGITVVSGFDLVGDVWEDRPPLSREPVWILPEEYAGMGAGEKIAEVRRVLKQKKQTGFFLPVWRISAGC